MDFGSDPNPRDEEELRVGACPSDERFASIARVFSAYFRAAMKGAAKTFQCPPTFSRRDGSGAPVRPEHDATLTDVVGFDDPGFPVRHPTGSPVFSRFIGFSSSRAFKMRQLFGRRAGTFQQQIEFGVGQCDGPQCRFILSGESEGGMSSRRPRAWNRPLRLSFLAWELSP